VAASLRAPRPEPPVAPALPSSDQEFPLAPVSLNFTAWTLAAARRGALDAAATRHPPAPPLRSGASPGLFEAADAFYGGLWAAFYARWRGSGATMRQAGFLLRRLERDARRGAARMLAAGAKAWPAG
jgi:hypothetical protein